MNLQAIENTARDLQSELGGVIFAFPIDESNPLSKYAVTTFLTGIAVRFLNR